MRKKTILFKNDNKSIKLKGFKHTIDMLEVDVVMLFGKDKIKALDELYDSDIANVAGTTMNYLPTHGEVIMTFNDKPNTNVIVHECTHATHQILHYLDIGFTHDNNEVFAYLSAHLVDIVKNGVSKC